MSCIRWLRNLGQAAAEFFGSAEDAPCSPSGSRRNPPILSFADAVLEDRSMPGETVMGILATSWALPHRSDALVASVADVRTESGDSGLHLGVQALDASGPDWAENVVVPNSDNGSVRRASDAGEQSGGTGSSQANSGEGSFDPLGAVLGNWDFAQDLQANAWPGVNLGNPGGTIEGGAQGSHVGSLEGDFAANAAATLFGRADSGQALGSESPSGSQNSGVGYASSVADSPNQLWRGLPAVPSSPTGGLPVSLSPPFPFIPAPGTNLPGLPRGPPLPMGTNPNAQVAQNYGQLPLIFEKNVGQTDPSVQFLAHGPGYMLFLTGTEAVLALPQGSGIGNQAGVSDPSAPGAALPFGPTAGLPFVPPGLPGSPTEPNLTPQGANAPRLEEVLRLQLIASDADVQAVGLDQVETHTNYFIGNDPTKWHTDIPNYAQVSFPNVYPGIDLVYHAGPSSPFTTNNSPRTNLEYDFVVHPGADPNQIQLAVQGAKDTHLDDQGNLVLTTPSGQQLTEHAPTVYQTNDPSAASNSAFRIPNSALVSGHYVLDDSAHIHFQVADYDHSRTLVIDPMLTYSTYLGGSSNDYATGIAIDGSGNAYVTGYTSSANFPLANPFQSSLGGQDVFIAKINPNGNGLVYSTYLGGSSSDWSGGIAVDATGSAFVIGTTGSEDFPVINAFQPTNRSRWYRGDNAFVTKLAPAGNALVYSTYLGGSAYDGATAIALDSNGDAYVTGATTSSDFPIQGAFQGTYAPGPSGPANVIWNAFVTELNAGGNALVYSTYLGGTGNFGSHEGDVAKGIAVDASGNTYVTGFTASSNFPLQNPFQSTNLGGFISAFVTKISSGGSTLVYSSYFGGGYTWATGIALDSAGNAYLSGQTAGNIPLYNAIQPVPGGGYDAFVAKINASGSGLIYSTYLGGSSVDSAAAIAVDSSGNAYVTGITYSNNFLPNFPTQNPLQASVGLVFITKLNQSGSSYIYSTHLGGVRGSGGTLGFGGDNVTAIAVDSAGNSYIVGTTSSTDFPLKNAFQTTLAGGQDAFVSKISPGPFVPLQFDSPGDLVATSTGTRGGNPQTTAFSEGGVRFFDGTVDLSTNDLSSGGFGVPWGQTRSWTNTASYPAVSQNGSGMIDTQLPYLYVLTNTATATTIAAVSTGTNARYFDLVNGNYQEKFFVGDQLTYNAAGNEFVLTDTAGDKIHFYDFSSNWPTLQQGTFKSLVDPYGNVTQVTSHAANGTVTEVQRSTVSNGNTITESYSYSYVQTGVNAGLLANVTLRRSVNGGQWSTVRQVAYTYYDGTDSAGDLEFAQVEDANGNVLDTTYYRYYLYDGFYKHALKYVFYPQSYARLTAALGTNVSALSDWQVAPYASYFFQYDISLRVTREDMPTGNGIGSYTFTYTKSNNPTDFNAWAVQTVETLPDQNTETVFSNGYGEVMLKDFFNVSSGQHWYTYTRYDAKGRVLWTADPAGVTGYSITYADLINYNGSTSPYLSSTQGEITINDYYGSTTAGESTAGGVAGYLQDTKVQFTQSGTPILQNTTQYFLHTANNISVAPVATNTVYRNTDGTGGETTSYGYGWYAGTAQAQTQTVTKPVISAAQNGPGVADQVTTYFDTYGRPVSTVDGDGHTNNTTYDPATGAVTQTVIDAGGLNLTTQIQADALGRPTKVTDPNQNVTYTVYKDTNYETRVYPGWNSTNNTTTGPTQDTREDRVNSYVETLTMSATPNVTGGAPDGSEAISNVQTLSRSYINQYGFVNRKDDYFNLSGLVYSSNPYIGTSGTNFYSTLYNYDSRGRLTLTQLPTGTMEQTLYDALSRKTSDWVGTSTANLVDVTDYQYDGTGVGDSDLTKVIQHPVGISTVTAISPTSGPIAGGTSVIINGTNLQTATGVSFGANAASFSVISDNQIVAVSPPVANPITVDVAVTTSAGVSPTSSADLFTYKAIPSITGIRPTAGPTGGGTSVTITGSGFTGAYSVLFGGSAASSLIVNSDTQITATSPSHSAGTVDIIVTTLGGTSATGSADQFTYVTPPTVTSISPTYGPTGGGTSVTITGTNLTGATAVSFGGTAASSFTVNSSTQITATSPAHASGMVDITVTTGGGTSATSSADQFTFNGAPSVTSISPTAGPTGGGTSVTVTGTAFTGATAVKFGTIAASSFTVNSSTQITATSPAESAGTVDVTVTTPSGTSAISAGDKFTYTAAPVVTSISPTSGPTGGNTSVSITGLNFSGATAVKFGTTNASSFHVISSTSITATSPAQAAGTVDITVTTSGGTSATSSADQFTYLAAPTVTAVTPTSGSTGGGTTVTITGTAFTGVTAVKFGSNNATSFTVNSVTQITAVSPAGSAGAVDITVTTPGGTSATGSADRFTYIGSPSISSVSPSSGPTAGGTSVTITGTNFTGSTAVSFGSTPATSYTINSSTQITATSPAESPGTIDITVTNSSGTSAIVTADHFTFVAPPIINSVSPIAGGIAGGTSVTILGAGFTGASAVKFGTTAASSYTVNSDTQITATSPAESAGTVDIRVTTVGGTSATSPSDQFTYIIFPIVTSISPTKGPALGGTSVTINGGNFTGATAVYFGKNPATSFTVNTDAKITATSPLGFGTVDVTVTASGQTSATSSADQFSYYQTPTVTAVSPWWGYVLGAASVVISGSFLTGTTAVSFGGVSASSFTINSDSQITVTSPAHSGTGWVDVTVTTPGGTSATSSADQFYYLGVGLPLVTLVNPATGSSTGGTTVTITGVNINGATSVKFGTVTASYTVNSSTQITATAPGQSVPPGGLAVDVSVTTHMGTSPAVPADRFKYYFNGTFGPVGPRPLGPGGSSSGTADRVTQYFYDWRNRVVAEKDGVQASEDTSTHRPIFYYTLDNLGEAVTTQHFDGDTVTLTMTNGVPQPPSASLLRAQTNTLYDDQGRVYQTQTYSVDQSTGALSATALTANLYYDHRGNLIEDAEPGAAVIKTTYDGAGRASVRYTTDGAGGAGWAAASSVASDHVLSQVETIYDGDSNGIMTTDREVFSDETATGALGNPTTAPKARVSYTTAYFDAANRLTASVDVGTNGGNAYTRPATPPAASDTTLVTSYLYNAAGWVSQVTDPRGLVTVTTYDNLGRTTQTIQDYTNGTPTATSNQTTNFTYDGDGNTLSVTAIDVTSGGAQTSQTTAYVYGSTIFNGAGAYSGNDLFSNDLQTAVQYPDPTTGQASANQQVTYTVDALGEIKTMKDRNASTHTYSYDVLGRQTADAVTTLGPNLDGTIQRMEIAYDTGDRPYLFTSFDAPSAGNIVNQVQDVFNGLGQLTAEYQSHSSAVVIGTTPSVQYAYTQMAGGVNNSRLTQITYPTTTRVTKYNYSAGVNDAISRVSSLADGTNNTLESYSYLGLGTIAQKSRFTGFNLTYIGAGQGDGGDKYVGLDRFGRVVDQNWTNGTVSTDRFQYGYDRNSNALYRNNVVNTNFGELYHVNGPANGMDGLNRQTGFARGVLSQQGSQLDTIVAPTRTQTWTLDGLGNQSTVTTNGVPANLTFNQQNEISTTGYSFDPNGNTSADAAGNTYVYDAWNRLIQVKNGANVLATYAYDAKGRRVKESDIAVTTKDVYFNSDWQILEEDQAGAVKAQYVWSADGQDDLVLRDATGYGFGVQYVQQDANGNVTAITDPGGNVLERYVYDSYGAVSYGDPSWNPRSQSSYAFNFLFQGGRMDGATGLYNFRNRDYSPFLGRWMENDPIGFAGGQNDLYAYEGDNPMSGGDPMGLTDWRDLAKSAAETILRVNLVTATKARQNIQQLRSLSQQIHDDKAGIEAVLSLVEGVAAIEQQLNTAGLQILNGQREEALQGTIAHAGGAAHDSIFVSLPAAAERGLIRVLATDKAQEEGRLVSERDILALQSSAGLEFSSRQRFLSQLRTLDPASYERGQVASPVYDQIIILAATEGLGAAVAPEAGLAEGELAAIRFAPRTATPEYPFGSFSIINWDGYPAEGLGIPRPAGPFRLLEGAEYEAARDLASATNGALHRADPSLAGLDIHEIHPVKFGGSPTDISNKVYIPRNVHSDYTKFWNALQRSLENR